MDGGGCMANNIGAIYSDGLVVKDEVINIDSD
jgi:hypothetical protein